MSTSLPPTIPKKDPGGRSFMLLALAIAVVGAFLLWRAVRQPGAEPAALPPPKSAAAPPPQVIEPPPPPPELPPDPGPPPTEPEPDKPSAPRRDTPHCEGECTGKETPELLSALRAKAGQARSCYERALTHNSSLSGSVLVNVRVSSTGAVCAASVGKDALGDAAVTNCVLQRFRSGKFPKPKGGCVDVALPINFVPAQR